MADQKTYLSKEKHSELTKELAFLKGTRRGEIAKQLEEAKAFGDLSENAEYHQAREAQALVESRIRELEELLKSVEIVSHHTSTTVVVGATVTVEKEGEGDKKTYEVVGSEEADTKAGRISLNSPLGIAMLGKSKGDTFTFTAPSGKKVNYKILKIE
ncbi:transcription elongation factor GreA [Candidatus Wolfebacteria bacterium]|nr:transcription elongation factor GreA [Candidatus Wolfebacteria bacterium]